MNITPTKEEWIQNYLRTYHKQPYTESKMLEAKREYDRKHNVYTSHKCDDLEIITYYDEETNERMVSHGVCKVCLRNVCIPWMLYSEYLLSVMLAPKGD